MTTSRERRWTYKPTPSTVSQQRSTYNPPDAPSAALGIAPSGRQFPLFRGISVCPHEISNHVNNCTGGPSVTDAMAF